MTTIAEIKEMLRTAGADELAAIERALAADTRKGVQSALKAARRRVESEERERQRLEGLYAFDALQLSQHGGSVLVGLDEVGRGAVAGPLAVGAVVLPADPMVCDLNDSKQLSPAQREEIALHIKEIAIAWAVEYVDPGEIDAQGMSRSLRRAFSGALRQIEEQGTTPDVVLIDGNPLGIDAREVNVVKGDATSAAIAAASVVAKVTRDAFMSTAFPDFPQYGFPDNKGYASAEHVNAIREYGLSPAHRASFCSSFLQQSLF